MSLNTEVKKTIISKFGQSTNDTGSPEIQIALLSQRISELTKHFESHIKDHSSRRGLLRMVGQRRRLLSYLKDKNQERYSKVIGELGIRK